MKVRIPIIIGVTWIEVAVLKEEEQVRDPLNTVDRLLRCKMEANERLNGLR